MPVFLAVMIAGTLAQRKPRPGGDKMPTECDTHDGGAVACPPVLEGKRLRLRGFVEADLAGMFGLHSDPQVMRYWSFPAWTDIGQASDYFAAALGGRDPDRLLCWVITLKGEDRLIGTLTLHAIDRPQGRAEIGYALDAAYWGRGLAQEAMRLVLDHAFGDMGLRRIEADVDPRNAGSCTLAERMGFVREGLLRERWCVGGEISDTALYGLLARDWR
jgi:[ribosomal protein S5]-alanine N-acetyltransferase